MAYDLFRGPSPKNFALQGHPPIHSFEYVMAGGGYCKPAEAPPPRRWRTEHGARSAESGASIPFDDLKPPKATAAAEAKDEATKGPERFGFSLLGLLAAIGVGYIGLKWVSAPKNTFVVSSEETIYNPFNASSEERHREGDHESEDSDGI